MSSFYKIQNCSFDCKLLPFVLSSEVFRKSPALHAYDNMKDLLSIPELLEHILFYLTPSDQLQCRGVSLTFRDIIDRSPRIRMAMFRDADLDNVNPAALPYRIKYVSFCLSTRREKSILTIYTFPRHDENILLAETSFLKSLLVAQPPPKHATISTQCACARVQDPQFFGASNKWLRVGDIFHMIKEYGRCPSCNHTLWEVTAELTNSGSLSVGNTGYDEINRSDA